MIEQILRLLDGIGDWLEKFSENRLRVDVTCALAASSWLTFIFYQISTISEPFNPYLCLKYGLIAFSSFVLTALFLWKCWRGALNRLLPRWILLSMLGALLNEIPSSIEWIPKAWQDPYFREMYPTFREFLSRELDMVRSVIIMNFFLTLPITGTIYYAGAIVRGIRKWHNRPEYNLSILGK
ncbi:MAG TPA: hypothetical protein VGW12_04920 [Pyrinomonadaceae bacterium]|nr:hypothetical protein [Pyrinomonadaceae bacterium]